MIPGKRYSPEDFLEIAWRRRWFIVPPFVLIALGTFLWVHTLPDRFKSTALVLVVSPQVPENYVKSTITETLKRRLDSMNQEIQSRTRLESLIREFNLYPELRQHALMDEVVERMRHDMNLNVAKAGRRQDPGHFEVSFESDNPKTSAAIANRLATQFVTMNTESRAVQVDSTAQFIDRQLTQARLQLQQHEQRLAAFRTSNSGRLPSDTGANLQMMKGSQDEIQSVVASINQDRERQLVIERTIAEEAALPAPARHTKGEGEGSDQSAAEQLATAEANLIALKLKFTEEHPDVRSLKRRIEELKKEAAAEALQQPVSGGPPIAAGTTSNDIARQRRIAALRTEHESLERKMATKRDRITQLEKAINDQRAKVAGAPALETQLTQLTRDYDSLRETYSQLLARKQQADIAADLEERQVGQVFRIIETAVPGDRPTSPDRVRLNIIGALTGLGIGLALAGLMEYRDRSLRTEDDVVVALSLPVLALVPTMITAVERRRRKKVRVLFASSGLAMALVCVVVIAWKFKALTAWIR